MAEPLQYDTIKPGDILVSDAGLGDCILPGKEYKVWAEHKALVVTCDGSRGDCMHFLGGHKKQGICLGFRRV